MRGAWRRRRSTPNAASSCIGRPGDPVATFRACIRRVINLQHVRSGAGRRRAGRVARARTSFRRTVDARRRRRGRLPARTLHRPCARSHARRVRAPPNAIAPAATSNRRGASRRISSTRCCRRGATKTRSRWAKSLVASLQGTRDLGPLTYAELNLAAGLLALRRHGGRARAARRRVVAGAALRHRGRVRGASRAVVRAGGTLRRGVAAGGLLRGPLRGGGPAAERAGTGCAGGCGSAGGDDAGGGRGARVQAGGRAPERGRCRGARVRSSGCVVVAALGWPPGRSIACLLAMQTRATLTPFCALSGPAPRALAGPNREDRRSPVAGMR